MLIKQKFYAQSSWWLLTLTTLLLVICSIILLTIISVFSLENILEWVLKVQQMPELFLWIKIIVFVLLTYWCLINFFMLYLLIIYWRNKINEKMIHLLFLSIICFNLVAIIVMSIKFWKNKKLMPVVFKKHFWKLKVFDLTLIAMFVSLTLVSDYLSILLPKMPFGGSFGLKYLPLFLVNYLTRFFDALITAVISSIVSVLLIPNALIINVWQYLWDYFLPMLAPIVFSFLKINFKDKFLAYIKIFFGITIVCFIIYFCHVVSGVLFFEVYVWKDFNVWTYSLIYNLLYVGFFVFLMLLVTIPILFRTLSYYQESLRNKLS